ncbi:MAG: YdhR family protein [Verrucomicrobiota bacterium]|nr:YdhR family protein [Verrucomicrobiota bacterium]
MHILIINFNLQDLSRAQFGEACQDLAQTFAEIPGLITKTWLANEETNTYGGVYHFENKQAMLDYKESEVFAAIGANPAFVNPVITDFGILEGPSKVTGIG